VPYLLYFEVKIQNAKHSVVSYSVSGRIVQFCWEPAMAGSYVGCGWRRYMLE